MAEGFTNPILLVRSPCWLKWPFIVVSKAHVVHWIIELSMRSQSFVGFFDTFMALSSYPAQSDCLPSVWTNFCLKSPSQLMTSRAGRRCFWEIRKWTNKFNTSFPSSFHGPNMFQIGANPSNKTWFLAEGVRIWTEKSWVTLSIVGGFTHSPVWSPQWVYDIPPKWLLWWGKRWSTIQVEVEATTPSLQDLGPEFWGYHYSKTKPNGLHRSSRLFHVINTYISYHIYIYII